MRSISSHRGIVRLAAPALAILLVAACTEPEQDVRSPAPTGSLSPAVSASPGAGGYSRGDAGTMGSSEPAVLDAGANVANAPSRAAGQ
jgi:hypothetical protein